MDTSVVAFVTSVLDDVFPSIEYLTMTVMNNYIVISNV